MNFTHVLRTAAGGYGPLFLPRLWPASSFTWKLQDPQVGVAGSHPAARGRSPWHDVCLIHSHECHACQWFVADGPPVPELIGRVLARGCRARPPTREPLM